MPPTNLLFLFTDEQRYDTLGAYGNRHIDTPNLDRLAGQSVLFDRAYVTQPVCTPSRSSLLTGQWPHTNGCTENNVPLPADVPCLPEMLPAGTYATGYHGKWHLGDEIYPQHGFDEWRSIEDGYRGHFSPRRDRHDRSTYHHWLLANGFRPAGDAFVRHETARFPELFSKPAYLAREAERFLREHRRDPFVLFVNFLEPHMPFMGPRDGQYDPDALPLPANFDATPTEDQHAKYRMFHDHYRRVGCGGSGPLADEADWRRLIARYWGLCSQVDHHVGTILATVEELGLDENTLVVYTSDHGDMMGSHRLVAKCVMFEEAVRVPMMIRLPGGTGGGRRIDAPVSQIDMVPTLLDLMGCDPHPACQGRSLRGLIEGRDADAGDVVIEWNGPNCGLAADIIGKVELPETVTRHCPPERAVEAITDPLRTIVSPDGLKLTVSPALGDHELYDLTADPGERTNLLADPARADAAADLLARLGTWQDETADPTDLPEGL